jgi:hypothetical protein
MAETAYCPTCRTHREVMDTYDTDDGDRYGTRPHDRHPRVARPLSCGHDANDGGAAPPAARRVDTTDTLAALVALQEGAS